MKAKNGLSKLNKKNIIYLLFLFRKALSIAPNDEININTLKIIEDWEIKK